MTVVIDELPASDIVFNAVKTFKRENGSRGVCVVQSW
jgi:hypothetical protein